MTIRETRKQCGLTQSGCAEYLGIPLRTYCRYEADESGIDPIRSGYIRERLAEYMQIDEEHGILTIDRIREVCSEIFPLYQVEFAYLFGSCATGKATGSSDVDILVSMPVDGLRFLELLETLREKLNKKVDLLDLAQLEHNLPLTREILRDGVKIYGSCKG